jgi:hypothetical protein
VGGKRRGLVGNSDDGLRPRERDHGHRGDNLHLPATSAGGTASRSVTVKRDATPPTLNCTANPNQLWPPNNKLVLVTTVVTVADALSGPAEFTLRAVTTSDHDPVGQTAGWVIGEPDTSGLLRAQRSGSKTPRTYTLAYRGNDAAGNSATCDALVTVPHHPTPERSS